MTAHHADAKPGEAKPRLDHQDGHGAPRMSPQAGRGQQRQYGKAEHHRRGGLGPPCQPRPVADDDATRDEEGEREGEQDPWHAIPALVYQGQQPDNGNRRGEVENVAHLDDVPETGAWVAALPMKIAGGSGGPLRLVALIER